MSRRTNLFLRWFPYYVHRIELAPIAGRILLGGYRLSPTLHAGPMKIDSSEVNISGRRYQSTGMADNNVSLLLTSRRDLIAGKVWRCLRVKCILIGRLHIGEIKMILSSPRRFKTGLEV